MITSSSISSGLNIKRKTVNLFDDDEDDLAKDDLLSALTKKDELVATKTDVKKTLTPAKVTIMNWLQPKLIKTQENIAKPKVRNIFNDLEDNEDDLFVKKTKDESKLLTQEPKITDHAKLEKPFVKTEIKKMPVNLFDDSKMEQPVIENKNKSVKLFDDFEDEPISENLSINKKPKKINLFDDLEDEEVDDLFSIKTKQTSIKKTPIESSLKEKQVESFEVTNKEVDREDIGKKINENILEESSLKDNEAKTLVETNKQIETKEIVNEKSPTVKENNECKIVSEDQILERNTNKKETIPEKTEDKEHVKDIKVLDNKENKTTDQSKLFENDENQLSKETTKATETSTDLSKLESKEIPIDHKELNNNDSTSIIPEKTITVAANTKCFQISNTSNKYDFNSVLLFDEPPEDDNAFFETLTKTPQALNNNYNAIDLEHDLYEPELPKVPVASASSNQTDSIDTKTNNLYTGLQLFSDIPPDDDDDHIAANDTSNPSPDVNSTKRLHSVFYDDFNETLMALNQNQIVKDITAHSIFSEEPPPINEELKSTTSKDTIDHKVPDVKELELKKDDKLKGSEIAAKLEEALTKPSNKNDTTAAAAAKRPVSKLQMPHININVQALLPGANNTLRKNKDEITKSITIEQDNNDVKDNIATAQVKEKKASSSTKPTAQITRTAETEHILPSVTKNRVRGPAARRPSTRRARQENYRKSMLEEPVTLESDDENKELEKQSNISHVSKSLNLENKTENFKEETTTSSSKESVTNLTNIAKDKSDIFEPKENVNKLDKKEEIKQKPIQTKTSLLFVDDEEEDDDDDLFKHIKISKTTTITTKTETKLNKNDNSATNLFANNPKVQVTKEQPKPSTSNAEPNAHVDSNTLTTTKPDNNTQPIKDKTKTEITKKPSFFDDDDDEEDDNDADLFKTNIQTKQTTNNSNTLEERNRIAKSKFKSFLDSESDEEPIVAGLQTTATTTSSQHTKTASTNKLPNVNIPSIKDSNTKLFSDSDTDSDDLFGKLSSTKTSNNNKTSTETTLKSQKSQIKTQTKSSLFSDDSDADDFPISSKNTAKNTASKSLLKEIKPKTAAQTNTSLFSDVDSDEDDLFGSVASKVATRTATNITNIRATTTTNIPNTKVTTATTTTTKPIASTAEVTKSKTIADNPLADLL
ncbi:WASH complex subunit 2 [Lucilia cuprina]|nr:WASH complex subunit 2 [Lucilia cuprina]